MTTRLDRIDERLALSKQNYTRNVAVQFDDLEALIRVAREALKVANEGCELWNALAPLMEEVK